MIVLNKEELRSIVIDEVTLNQKQTPKKFSTSLAWKHMKYESAEKMFYVDESLYYLNLFSFVGRYGDQKLQYRAVKDYLKRKYPNANKIDLVVQLKAIKEDVEKMCDRNIQDIIDIKAYIDFDEEVKLDKHNLRELIDLSLTIKDEKWFLELSSKYKDLN